MGTMKNAISGIISKLNSAGEQDVQILNELEEIYPEDSLTSSGCEQIPK